jgi:putative peptidoglycan lipid II flippase
MQIDSGADVGTKAHRPGKFLCALLSRPLVRDTLTTTILSTFGKAAGFLIPFFIAAWFGISSSTDAFFFSYAIVFFLATTLSAVIETVIVPFISELMATGDDIGDFIGRILINSTVGLTGLLLIVIFFIKPVLSFLMTTFSATQLQMVYNIFLLLCPLAVLIVWTSILSGALNAYKIFSIPALSPAFRAVVTIGSIFSLKNRFGIYSIIIGYLLGEMFRVSILFASIKKFDFFRIRLSFNLERKTVEFFKTSSYQVLSMSLLAFSTIINRTMASWLGPGNISLLEYAERLYLIPGNLIGFGIIVTILSHWSEKFYRQEKDRDEMLEKDVKKTFVIVSILSLAITLFFSFSSSWLIPFVFRHDKFPANGIIILEKVFLFFMAGFVFNSLGLVYIRAYIVQKRTKALFRAAVFTCVVNVILNLVLMRKMGLPGIALSTSITSLLTFLALFKYFHVKSRIAFN